MGAVQLELSTQGHQAITGNLKMWSLGWRLNEKPFVVLATAHLHADVQMIKEDFKAPIVFLSTGLMWVAILLSTGAVRFRFLANSHVTLEQ